MTTYATVHRAVADHADPKRARASRWFFKTGPGEYGEGDVFAGLTVPVVRRLARTFRDADDATLARLLASRVHEERLLALVVLVDRFRRSKDEAERRLLHRFYLRHLDRVNNWDLVDVSAPDLLGTYLSEQTVLLSRLARSRSVWRRRIAVMAHAASIRRGEAEPMLRFAERFLDDEHDLIHKAVGWMLREVGARVDASALRRFLDRHAAEMPRTMLRYAIEKFPPRERARFMGFRSPVSTLRPAFPSGRSPTRRKGAATRAARTRARARGRSAPRARGRRGRRPRAAAARGRRGTRP